MLDPDRAINTPGRQGWEQFLNWKRELLAAFEWGRKYSRGHEVETYHGLVAEAHFRNWLSEFLPKKFGVTAGYIVSQAVPPGQKMPAFDVIVYDQLQSPVLWARDGNYHWKMGVQDSDYGSRIYFTHKRCCHAFEAGQDFKRFMWAAFELVGLPIRLGDNLALDWKVARRRVDIGLYD